jgi:hypothetical protein
LALGYWRDKELVLERLKSSSWTRRIGLMGSWKARSGWEGSFT